MAELGLVKYDSMCLAIAECKKVDEAKEIRDKARALEVYAAQALNVENERLACEIRIRAERRTGELLKETKDSGQRADRANGRPKKASDGTTLSSPRLADLGISRDQSSKWQQLAEIPAEKFERSIRAEKPTTEGVLQASRETATEKAIAVKPQIETIVLNSWGRICDFERYGLLSTPLSEFVKTMTLSMRKDVQRLAPLIVEWLTEYTEGRRK